MGTHHSLKTPLNLGPPHDDACAHVTCSPPCQTSSPQCACLQGAILQASQSICRNVSSTDPCQALCCVDIRPPSSPPQQFPLNLHLTRWLLLWLWGAASSSTKLSRAWVGGLVNAGWPWVGGCLVGVPHIIWAQSKPVGSNWGSGLSNEKILFVSIDATPPLSTLLFSKP